MRLFTSSLICPILLLALIQAAPALGADAEIDALSLESAPEAAPQTTRETKFFIEGAIVNASQRYLPESRNSRRVSLDFSHSARLAPGLRAVVSNRLDHLYPTAAGADANASANAISGSDTDANTAAPNAVAIAAKFFFITSKQLAQMFRTTPL